MSDERCERCHRVYGAALSRIESMEKLLVCYRVGRRPTERLHEELAHSGTVWLGIVREFTPKDKPADVDYWRM